MSGNYDPCLKEAMAKIKAIMDEYQIGGNVVLSSRDYAESLYHFPDWSVIQINKDGTGVDIRSKPGDYENEDQRNKDTSDSVGIVVSIRDISAQTFQIFQGLVEELSKYVEIDHQPMEFTPHFES
jgi:hypothetical protein